MPGNKKPKKAYKPRPVYRPMLINSFSYFGPLGACLERLAERQEIEVDEHGFYVFQSGKELLGLADAIDVFIRYTEVMFLRMKKPAQLLGPVRTLLTAVQKKEPFDYDNIIVVKRIFDQYCQIFATLPGEMSRSMLQSVKTQLAIERSEQAVAETLANAGKTLNIVPEGYSSLEVTLDGKPYDPHTAQVVGRGYTSPIVKVDESPFQKKNA